MYVRAKTHSLAPPFPDYAKQETRRLLLSFYSMRYYIRDISLEINIILVISYYVMYSIYNSKRIPGIFCTYCTKFENISAWLLNDITQKYKPTIWFLKRNFEGRLSVFYSKLPNLLSIAPVLIVSYFILLLGAIRTRCKYW